MSGMPASAMIFAAGLGTRMGALTRARPKPLIEVAGRTLIDRTLDMARAAGIARLVVNVHYKAAMLRAHLDGKGVQVSDETERLLDTGGGLRAALPMLGEDPVVTLNSDAIWRGPNPVDLLAAEWDGAAMEALLICVPRARAVGRRGGGDFSISPEGRLARGGDLVYGGAQIIRTGRVAARQAEVFSLNEVWDEMAAAGRLFGVVHPGHWCDVGHPDGIALAETLLAEPHV